MPPLKQDTFGPTRALALRDYYPFWKSRNERSRAGKLLVLDPDDHGTIQARSACCSCRGRSGGPLW